MAFQQSSRGASLLSWLVVPCSPLAPQVKLSLQVVALRVHVTAHSETTSLKERAQDLSHKETAVGHGEDGASLRVGEHLPSVRGCLHQAEQLPPLQLLSIQSFAHTYKDIYSHVNLAQKTFCCLTSTLIFAAVTISVFTHWQ